VTFDGDDKPYEIVGVSADANCLKLYEPPTRMVHLNAFQELRRLPSQLWLQTTVSPSAATGDVRAVVAAVLKTVRIAKVATMDNQVNASIIPERLIATLSGFFAGLEALLAAIGLYGLLAYTVARRTGEIGVRMALGATEGDVMRMVLASALGLVCAWLAIGAPIAVWSGRGAATVMENIVCATVCLPVSGRWRHAPDRSRHRRHDRGGVAGRLYSHAPRRPRQSDGRPAKLERKRRRLRPVAPDEGAHSASTRPNAMPA
jgi:hypothetical protein